MVKTHVHHIWWLNVVGCCYTPWTIYRWFSQLDTSMFNGFSSSLCEKLPEAISHEIPCNPITNPIEPPFSYGFPMVFLWVSYGFPMVFLWFSYGFPMVGCCYNQPPVVLISIWLLADRSPTSRRATGLLSSSRMVLRQVARVIQFLGHKN